MTSPRRPLAATAALLLALTLAACGDDGAGEEPAGDDPSSQPAASDATSADVDADDVTTGGGGDADGNDTDSPGRDDDDDTPPDGSSPISTSASKADFCGGLEAVVKATGEGSAADVPTRAQWQAIQEVYADWAQIGAPSGITKAQLDGFEVVVDTIAGIDYDQARELYASDDPDIPGLSEDDDALADGFIEYADDFCQTAD